MGGVRRDTAGASASAAKAAAAQHSLAQRGNSVRSAATHPFSLKLRLLMRPVWPSNLATFYGKEERREEHEG